MSHWNLRTAPLEDEKSYLLDAKAICKLFEYF